MTCNLSSIIAIFRGSNTTLPITDKGRQVRIESCRLHCAALRRFELLIQLRIHCFNAE